MKGDTTGRKLKPSKGTDWDRLRTMSDAQVHEAVPSDPDVHPTDEDFWKDAKAIFPRRKEVVTMRLDADLLEWFRKQRSYQTRINAILHTYHKESPKRPATTSCLGAAS